MSFKTLPNTQHWYQWTYGVVESNWALEGQGLLVLNSGEVWVWLINSIAAYSYGEQQDAMWIGTVSPEGNVRKFGDSWAHGATVAEASLRTTDTFAPHTSVTGRWRPADLFTDGSTIYVLQRTGWTGGAGVESQIWSLDPDTLALEWVFGTGDSLSTNDAYTDNHDAKLATAVNPRNPTYWNGAFYFWDHPIKNGNDHFGQINTLRKWEPGGGVSTVTPSMSDPTGLTTGTGDGWFGDANADGLPKVLNDDVLVTDDDYFGSVVYDDWLYVIGRSWEDFYAGDLGYTASWIKRLDLNNPDNGAETLYYGLSREFSTSGSDGPLPRDWESDFADTPEGAGTSYFGYVPGKGTPDLYGFRPGYQATVVNDDLIFDNISVTTLLGGSQTFGTQICAMHLPTLLERAVNGPVRHDRANPLFRIIANGASTDHSYSSFNTNNRWAQWNTMDGGNPALTHVSVPSLYSNPNSDEWAGKILYMNSSIDTFGGMPNFEGVQSHLVHVLEPKAESTQSFNVEFSFEGQVLKGYGPAAGITPPDCPEEVTLQ